MITGTKEKLDDLTRNYVCSEHQTPVVVAWHAGENSYVLRCGQGHFPEEITRELTPIEEHKAGKRDAFEPIRSLLPKTDLVTGELLGPDMVKSLMDYAYRYELDPFRGHVVLMYGKPYISIDGYLYHAKALGRAYTLDSRPLKEEELKDYRAPENAHVWISRVRMTDTGSVFVGYGVVTQEEIEAKSPRDAKKLRSPVVAAHPWQLAQKRAEWQALRRAFPIGESEEVKDGTGAIP